MGTYRIEEAPTVFAKRKSEFLRNATLIVQTAATAFQEAVVRDTPVDTGKARSNWVASVGSPFSGEIGPYSPGKDLGISESANASAAIAQAKQVIAGFVARDADTAIYISNNVRYIGYLNEPGSTNKPSHQSFPNFVQLAIEEAVASVTGRKVFVE